MSAAILPADPMIDVLTDAIASKRDTMAIMEAALKKAREDLAHLRERRAHLQAKVAGFEVGQVWIADTYNHRKQPGVIVVVSAGYGDDDANDWTIEIAFGHEQGNRSSIRAKVAATDLIGRVDSGPLVESLQQLLQQTAVAA